MTGFRRITVVLALLAASSFTRNASAQTSLTIQAVVPNAAQTQLTVSGTNMCVGPTVTLGGTSLSLVGPASTTSVTAALPSLSSGTYFLVVSCGPVAGRTANIALTLGGVGPMGPGGAAGPQGIAGPAGAAGTPGAIGAAGPQGAVGPSGVAGAIGPQGPAGASGPQGLQGVAGAGGPIGPIGPEGPAGLRGLQGEQGPPASSGDLARVAYATGGIQLPSLGPSQNDLVILAVTPGGTPGDLVFIKLDAVMDGHSSTPDVGESFWILRDSNLDQSKTVNVPFNGTGGGAMTWVVAATAGITETFRVQVSHPTDSPLCVQFNACHGYSASATISAITAPYGASGGKTLE